MGLPLGEGQFVKTGPQSQAVIRFGVSSLNIRLSVESDAVLLGALTFGDPVSGTYLAALPLMSTAAARREIFFGHVAVGLLDNVDYFTGLALVTV